MSETTHPVTHQYIPKEFNPQHSTHQYVPCILGLERVDRWTDLTVTTNVLLMHTAHRMHSNKHNPYSTLWQWTDCSPV